MVKSRKWKSLSKITLYLSSLRRKLVVILFLVWKDRWTIYRSLPSLHLSYLFPLWHLHQRQSWSFTQSCVNLSILLAHIPLLLKTIILQHVFFTPPFGGIAVSGVHDICTAFPGASLICMAPTKRMEPHRWRHSALRNVTSRTAEQVPLAYVLFPFTMTTPILTSSGFALTVNRQWIPGTSLGIRDAESGGESLVQFGYVFTHTP